MNQDFLLTLDQASNLINKQINESVYTPTDLVVLIAQVKDYMLICKPFAPMAICKPPKGSFFVFDGCFRLVDSSVSNVVEAAAGSILSGSNEFSGIEHFQIDEEIKNKTLTPDDVGGNCAPDGLYGIVNYDGFAKSACEAVRVYENTEVEGARLPRSLKVKPFFPILKEIYVLNSEFRDFVNFVLNTQEKSKLTEEPYPKVVASPTDVQLPVLEKTGALEPEPEVIKGRPKTLDKWVLYQIRLRGLSPDDCLPWGFQAELISKAGAFGYSDNSAIKRSWGRLKLKSAVR